MPKVILFDATIWMTSQSFSAGATFFWMKNITITIVGDGGWTNPVEKNDCQNCIIFPQGSGVKIKKNMWVATT